jgi:hypothetical protein
MTFEEDFPSLKDGVLYAEDYADKTNIGRLLHLEDVEMFCLDKSKVREAWIKFFNNFKWIYGRHLKNEYTLCQFRRKMTEYNNDLKKELGLTSEDKE